MLSHVQLKPYFHMKLSVFLLELELFVSITWTFTLCNHVVPLSICHENSEIAFLVTFESSFFFVVSFVFSQEFSLLSCMSCRDFIQLDNSWNPSLQRHYDCSQSYSGLHTSTSQNDFPKELILPHARRWGWCFNNVLLQRCRPVVAFYCSDLCKTNMLFHQRQ